MWTESIEILNPYEATKASISNKHKKKIGMFRNISIIVKQKVEIFLYNRGYHKIKDLQGWGHCGLCGKYIPNTVMRKSWAWDICDECKNLK